MGLLDNIKELEPKPEYVGDFPPNYCSECGHPNRYICCTGFKEPDGSCNSYSYCMACCLTHGLPGQIQCARCANMGQPCCFGLCAVCCVGRRPTPEELQMGQMKREGAAMKPRTQKAKGIRAMRNLYDVSEQGCRLWDGILIQSVEKAKLPFVGTRFARPCPSRPRHGFVDSRPVYTKADVAKVVEETLVADPEGEVLVGPYIEAEYSAILAGNRLAVGPGHDGATSGNDVVEFGVEPFKLGSYMQEKADIKNTAYMEIVYDSQVLYMDLYPQPVLVQLRDGPPLPETASDYVPKKVTVARVVSPLEDMLEWEQYVTTLKEGDVVWAPNGSLASHAAIHCVANQIPFFARSEPPTVGSVIEPTDLASKVTLDPDEMLVGMKWAANLDNNDIITKPMTNRALIASTVVHNWPYLRKWPLASRLLGAACVGLSQVCASLCVGEARHYSLEKQKQIDTEYGRTYCWEECLTDGELSEHLADAKLAFSLSGWSGGYGGEGWLNAAERTVNLWDLIRCFNETGMVNEDSLIGALNACLNAVHNNGSLLDKLGITEVLDGASAITAVHAGPVVWELANYSAVPEKLDWPAVPVRDIPPKPTLKKVKKRYAQIRWADAYSVKVQMWPRDGVDSSHISTVLHHPAAARLLRNMEHDTESRAGPDNAMYVYLGEVKVHANALDVVHEFVLKNSTVSYG